MADQTNSDEEKREQWAEIISTEPRLSIHHNFLSRDECEHLINLAKPSMGRSMVYSGDTGPEVNSKHTGFESFLNRGQDKIVRDVEERIAKITSIPVDHGEGLRIVHYEVGQKFEPDSDTLNSPPKNGGQHVATVLLYLSDVEEGGETVFPAARGNFKSIVESGEKRLVVKPKLGDALFFWNTKPDGTVDPLSLHSASPVLKGDKWASIKLLHLNKFEVVQVPNYSPKTLWIGDLQYWINESYLYNCFYHTGDVVNIRIIRNRITGFSEGYGFIEFSSQAAAEKILQSYNGTPMPGTELPFRLNLAFYGNGRRQFNVSARSPEYSIFVGNLAHDVKDNLLLETFVAHYSSVKAAKVMTNPDSGRSKGYGFVKFSNEQERDRAMSEMDGVFCSTRPMRICPATPKNPTDSQADKGIKNTTVFIGNLDPNVTDDELREAFVQFGNIVYVKIPVGRGCGFVRFETRTSAEEAIQKMQGIVIGQQIIQTSWGRRLKPKQEGSWGQQVDRNWHWGNVRYGCGEGCDAYAYGAAHDPSLYAYGAEGGYAHYSQLVYPPDYYYYG